jgi:hypothetical protein
MFHRTNIVTRNIYGDSLESYFFTHVKFFFTFYLYIFGMLMISIFYGVYSQKILLMPLVVSSEKSKNR